MRVVYASTDIYIFFQSAAGLGSYVEALVRKHDSEFNVCFPSVQDFSDK